MEYTDGQVEQYIKDNIHRIKEKVIHMIRMMMAQSIMVSTRIISDGEREYGKIKAKYTQLNLNKASVSAQQNTNRHVDCDVVIHKFILDN